MTVQGYHVGRSWSGHEIEDKCPCVKAPCGLVSEPDPQCPDHAPEAAKTIRQRHPAFLCPGLLAEARKALVEELMAEHGVGEYPDQVWYNKSSAGGAPEPGESAGASLGVEALPAGLRTPPADLSVNPPEEGS